MKTIVAGSRIGITIDDVENAMATAPFKITEVVSGTAKGADEFGEVIANRSNIPVIRFPADWKNLDVQPCKIKQNKYGKYNALAGHNRNQKMAEYAEALIAVWDGKSPGTKNTIETMEALGKIVFIYFV